MRICLEECRGAKEGSELKSLLRNIAYFVWKFGKDENELENWEIACEAFVDYQGEDKLLLSCLKDSGHERGLHEYLKINAEGKCRHVTNNPDMFRNWVSAVDDIASRVALEYIRKTLSFRAYYIPRCDRTMEIWRDDEAA